MAVIEQPRQISPDVLYTLPEAMRITGLGKAAMRAARQRGLPVRYAGGRGFVLGAALIEHILTAGKEVKAGAPREHRSGTSAA